MTPIEKKQILITKKQITEAIDNNYTGVKFTSKKVQRRFEKNKAIVAKRDARIQNLRATQAKNTNETQMPEADLPILADFSQMDDAQLVKSMIVLGVTPADLMAGGVDSIRVLRLHQESTCHMASRQAPIAGKK